MSPRVTQRPGIDYFETFAPVARKESVKVALAIAAEQDLLIENVDVNTAFLYGEVKEEIYMDQPDGFVDEEHREKKCFLTKHFMVRSRRLPNIIID